ncbi:MAG: response regulator transcription factor [Bacteroidota bacterium]
MLRILLVEDEENIRDTVKLNLELEDYEVVVATDGKSALRNTREQHFDLIILDVMLPELDGFQVCEQIRLTNRDIPIIFLTAKDQAQDRIQGLKRGGDDYLTKPFVFEELHLRVQRLLERTSNSPLVSTDEYEFGQNKVNFATFEATGSDGDFTLTKKEAMLLKLLVDRRGEVVSRQQILQAVWGYDVYPSTRTIDNFILSFRKYFEEDPKSPRFFQSVRGVGYKFAG